jgi:hypothetical protein
MKIMHVLFGMLFSFSQIKYWSSRPVFIMFIVINDWLIDYNMWIQFCGSKICDFLYLFNCSDFLFAEFKLYDFSKFIVSHLQSDGVEVVLILRGENPTTNVAKLKPPQSCIIFSFTSCSRIFNSNGDIIIAIYILTEKRNCALFNLWKKYTK